MSRYEGTIEQGLFHGQGKLIYENGEYYQGDFVRGKIHGNGALYLASGDRYEGEWRDGKRHGRGIYTYHDGDQYDGEWKNDERLGSGIMISRSTNGNIDEKYDCNFWSDKCLRTLDKKNYKIKILIAHHYFIRSHSCHIIVISMAEKKTLTANEMLAELAKKATH